MRKLIERLVNQWHIERTSPGAPASELYCNHPDNFYGDRMCTCVYLYEAGSDEAP